MTIRQHIDVVRYDRSYFINDVWDYKPGDMVTILAPYGGGKTELGFQLLEATAKPDLPAIIFVVKSRDETVSRYVKRNKYRVIRDWPPSRLRNVVDKPSGYVLWPRETTDWDASDERAEHTFRNALRGLYHKGNVIVFVDETYSLENELNLKKDLVRVWTKGRSQKCGLWAGSQRPVWINRWALQAHHLFLGLDMDREAQKRYGEIGAGIDPDVVRTLVSQLKRYEFVYINRLERTLCIVSA